MSDLLFTVGVVALMIAALCAIWIGFPSSLAF